MNLSLEEDTLAFQCGIRPSLQLRDMSKVPLQAAVGALRDFSALSNLQELAPSSGIAEPVCGNPEKDALLFYLLNHATSVVRQRVHPLQPLGKYAKILDLYHDQLALRSTRMFYYILLICTRESRHDKSSVNYALKDKYGSAITNFHLSIKGKASLTAADMFKSSAPECTIGDYTAFLAEKFYTGAYSSGYGGKAWGKVADVLRDFVWGKLTAEMMMDTAFTLCHNNGPIFNKGMLYEMHTKPALEKILDVQRSGQIPQLIGQDPFHTSGLDSSVKAAWVMCRDILGTAFDGHVDWYQVEALGALKSYPQEKSMQAQKYGVPANAKSKMEVEAAKLEALLATAALEASLKAKSQIEVFPKQFIHKIKYIRKA